MRRPDQRAAAGRHGIHRRAVQLALHLIAIAGLLGALGASVALNGYLTRGVATGEGAAPIPHTDVNPLGVNVFLNAEPDPEKVARSLDMIAAAGITYVRQMFPWYEIEPEPDTYWDSRNNVGTWEKYDRIVDLATARNLEIIARLDKPPRWAREGQPNLDRFPTGPPTDVQDYADFVATFVERYRGRVHYIQIWNEPNLEGEWGGQPIDPAAFTALLKAAYTAAKAVDPTIAVLMPGLAPTDQRGPANLSDLLFLQGMYDAGAKDAFDIASVMVYGYGYSPADRRVDFARNNFSRPIQTREIMVRNGDAGKPIWAAEYGWVALPDDWAGDPSPWGAPVSEAEQADYLAQGYLRARQEWPWMGVMCVWHFRTPEAPDRPEVANDPTRGFALVNHDFSPRPAYTRLAATAPALNRAYTGAHPVGSPFIERFGDWQPVPGDPSRLVPAAPGAMLRVPFSGTGLDVDLGSGRAGYAVTIDGSPAPGLPLDAEGRAVASAAGEAEAGRVTVARDLADGPHLAELTALAGPDGVASFGGVVVVREPALARRYPRVNAATLTVLVLNLGSLALLLRRPPAPAPAPEPPSAPGRVRTPAELRAARRRRPRTRPSARRSR